MMISKSKRKKYLSLAIAMSLSCFAYTGNAQEVNGETVGSGNLSLDIRSEYEPGEVFSKYENSDLNPNKKLTYHTPTVGANREVKVTTEAGASAKIEYDNLNAVASSLDLSKIVIQFNGEEKDLADFSNSSDMYKYLNDSYWLNQDYAKEINDALTSSSIPQDTETKNKILEAMDFEKLTQLTGRDEQSLKNSVNFFFNGGKNNPFGNGWAEKVEVPVFEEFCKAYKEALGKEYGSGADLENMPQFVGYDKNGNIVELSLDGLKFSMSQGTYINDVSKDYYTYKDTKVKEGSVWRPMDRLEKLQTGYLDGNYVIGSVFGINKDGEIVFGQGNGEGEKPTDGSLMGSETTSLTDKNTTEELPYGDATTIAVEKLEIESGGMIDLSYINTFGTDPLVNKNSLDTSYPFPGYTGYYRYEYIDDYGNKQTGSRHLNRYLLADNAVLADNITFRLGVYGREADGAASINESKTGWTLRKGTNDAVYIANAVVANKKDGAVNKIYVQLGWAPGVGIETSGSAQYLKYGYDGNSTKQKAVVVGILNGAEDFEVEGQKSIADGIFSNYEIDVTLEKEDNYFDNPENAGEKTGTAWYIKEYKYQDTGNVAESGKSAADNALVANNLWKSNYLNMFGRTSNLHRFGYLGEKDEKENIWAYVNHGKFENASAYGRSISQSYNGYYVGYDKMLGKGYWDGRSYVGFFVNKTDGNSNTATGKGDQESLGLGIYTTWIGEKGHYLDFGITAAKLKNDFNLISNTGSGEIGKVTGNMSTWAYGLGAQYGYQKKYASGIFWEPYMSLFLGHVDENTYTLSNKLMINQQGYDTVTGKYGINIGKEFVGKGSVYAGVAAVQEFGSKGKVTQYYQKRDLTLDEHNGTDLYAELTIGSNIKISPTGTINFDFVRNFGSDIGKEWSINGGANWTWGGFYGSNKKGAAQKLTSQAEIAADADVILESTGKFENTEVYKKSGHMPTVVIGGSSATASVHDAGEAAADVSFSGIAAEGTVEDGFVLPEVTVSSARPDWEKKLSPGQVTVIHTKEFAGEQKDLPEMLERVPGLFVQRVSGTGHYTVARVRGSTAAQVNVYVDGVLMNLNGESGVNLSTIPVDNVERIEVYRGYVPARFSGSPLGGVINIVTKNRRNSAAWCLKA